MIPRAKITKSNLAKVTRKLLMRIWQIFTIPLAKWTRNDSDEQDVLFVEAFAVRLRRIQRALIIESQASFERAVQTLKHEVLNGFCVVSERHLDHVLRRAAD
jgi:hypothetical protein